MGGIRTIPEVVETRDGWGVCWGVCKEGMGEGMPTRWRIKCTARKEASALCLTGALVASRRVGQHSREGGAGIVASFCPSGVGDDCPQELKHALRLHSLRAWMLLARQARAAYIQTAERSLSLARNFASFSGEIMLGLRCLAISDAMMLGLRVCVSRSSLYEETRWMHKHRRERNLFGCPHLLSIHPWTLQ